MFQATVLLMRDLLKDAVLHAASGFNGVLDGAKIGLYTNSPAITAESVLGDFDAPTYPGYLEQAAGAWLPPFQREDGAFVLSASPKLFQMDDATVPTVIKGALLIQPGSPEILLGVTVFDADVALATVDDGCLVEVELVLSPTGFLEGPNVD